MEEIVRRIMDRMGMIQREGNVMQYDTSISLPLIFHPSFDITPFIQPNLFINEEELTARVIKAVHTYHYYVGKMDGCNLISYHVQKETLAAKDKIYEIGKP